MRPDIIGMRRQEDLTDEELDLMNDPESAEMIRAQRRERADRAMNHLSKGDFTTVASSYVKEDEDAGCVICCANFT